MNVHRFVAVDKRKTKMTMLFIFIVVVCFSAGLIYNTSLVNHGPKSSEGLYKPGKGGNPKDVVKYHDEAVAAWKAGDNSKAKKLADKGLEANSKLTIDQQQQIPHQMNIIFELGDLSEGHYYGK